MQTEAQRDLQSCRRGPPPDHRNAVVYALYACIVVTACCCSRCACLAHDTSVQLIHVSRQRCLCSKQEQKQVSIASRRPPSLTFAVGCGC
jgi:hypothetical protein